MKTSRQLLLAFFIPLTLAIILAGAAKFILTDPNLRNQDEKFPNSGNPIKKFTPPQKGAGMRFSAYDCFADPPLKTELKAGTYFLIIVSLIILSELLPLIIYLRNRKLERIELKLN